MPQNQYSNKTNQNKQLNNCINGTNKVSNKQYICTPYQSLPRFDITLNDKNNYTFDTDNRQSQQICQNNNKNMYVLVVH